MSDFAASPAGVAVNDDQAACAKPGRMPWDLHPSLTAERLRVCARLLANARRDAVAMASHALGDDAWSVGCRAYAFSRHRLQRAAEAGEHAWLRVLDGSHHFVFLVEDVPVRFFRGAADDPTERTLRRQEVESKQLTLALGGAQAAENGLVFRLAVETGSGGRVERVVFLALRGEADAVECFWPVPLDVEQAGLPHGAREGAVQLRLIADDGYAGPLAGLTPKERQAAFDKASTPHRAPNEAIAKSYAGLPSTAGATERRRKARAPR